MITDAARVANLIEQIEPADRVAIDTEADSLHSYREKLCLLQISVPAPDAVAGVSDAGARRRSRECREGRRLQGRQAMTA